jgi:hypothetical protein
MLSIGFNANHISNKNSCGFLKQLNEKECMELRMTLTELQFTDKIQEL